MAHLANQCSDRVSVVQKRRVCQSTTLRSFHKCLNNVHNLDECRSLFIGAMENMIISPSA